MDRLRILALPAAVVILSILAFACSAIGIYGLGALGVELIEQGKYTALAIVGLGSGCAFIVITFLVLGRFARRDSDARIGRSALGKTVRDWLQSGVFYFFAGLGLIVAAFWSQSAESNSTLTFVLALLGIAILLYGTGSQAVLSAGQGSPSLDAKKMEAVLEDKLKEPTKAAETAKKLIAIASYSSGHYANFAVAGGAAALTAFFGWAITERKDVIRDVFRDHTRYDLVAVELRPSGVELGFFKIDARLSDGQDLYVRNSRNKLFVSVPEEISKREPSLSIDFTRIERPGSGEPLWDAVARKFDPQFSAEVQLKETGNTCTRIRDNDAAGSVNETGSLEAPVREWRCFFDVKRKVTESAFIAPISEKDAVQSQITISPSQ